MIAVRFRAGKNGRVAGIGVYGGAGSAGAGVGVSTFIQCISLATGDPIKPGMTESLSSDSYPYLEAGEPGLRHYIYFEEKWYFDQPSSFDPALGVTFLLYIAGDRTSFMSLESRVQTLVCRTASGVGGDRPSVLVFVGTKTDLKLSPEPVVPPHPSFTTLRAAYDTLVPAALNGSLSLSGLIGIVCDYLTRPLTANTITTDEARSVIHDWTSQSAIQSAIQTATKRAASSESDRAVCAVGRGRECWIAVAHTHFSLAGGEENQYQSIPDMVQRMRRQTQAQKLPVAITTNVIEILNCGLRMMYRYREQCDIAIEPLSALIRPRPNLIVLSKTARRTLSQTTATAATGTGSGSGSGGGSSGTGTGSDDSNKKNKKGKGCSVM